MALCGLPVGFVNAILALTKGVWSLGPEHHNWAKGHPVFSVKDVFPLLLNSIKLEINLKILSLFLLDRFNVNPYIYVLIDCWLGGNRSLKDCVV